MINPRQVKVKIGHVDCLTPGCNTRIPVRQNPETGALSYPCIECGAPNYAKADGSAHYHSVIKRMTPLAPESTGEPVHEHVPPKPAKTGLFV